MPLAPAATCAMAAPQTLLYALTYLGSAYAHAAVVALVAWWLSPATGRRLGFVLAVSFACSLWIKEAVGYPRPFEIDVGSVSDLVRATAAGASWPSGHAQNTTAVWSFLALAQSRERPRERLWLWAAAAAMVAVVGATRVLLGVHFPGDVLGGVAVGLAVALVAGFGVWRLPGWEPWLRWTAGAGALAVWAAGGVQPDTAGLAAGCLLAEGRLRPAAGPRRRLLAVAGGALVCAAVYAGLRQGLWALVPGAPSGWAVGAATLAAALVALDGWPWLARRWGLFREPAEPEGPAAGGAGEPR